MIISSITQRLKEISLELPSHVRLVAITKKVSVESIREAYGFGIRDFGESRIQEALKKQEQLQDLADIQWHFIGHLQSNKAKQALESFQCIQSCDSLKLAKRLNRLAGKASSGQVLLQVKVLPDPNKYGWGREELLADLPELEKCQNLKIRGLMTILPLGLSEQETLAAFQETQQLAAKIAAGPWSNLQMHELSMGMSADYPLAIEAGATMIRLGRIIFGEREP